jgi:hypothetical protein
MSEAQRVHRFPVDAHVHFHYPERVVPTLDSAVANLAEAGRRTTGLIGALLLTEAADERIFRTLRSRIPWGTWRLDSVAAESMALIAESSGRKVLIVCGRQIRCKRGLEVLALGTEAEFAEGADLDVTVQRVRAEGALPVVPWGFGKWLGARGARVRELLDSHQSGSLFVGDNGGRLAWSGLPRLVADAERTGHRILPGSDPFPFGNDYRRVGAFGFIANISSDDAATWTTLRAWLETSVASPEGYGRALDGRRFAINQLGIQIYNRLKQQRSHRR